MPKKPALKEHRKTVIAAQNAARRDFKKLEKSFFALLDGKVAAASGDTITEIAKAEKQLVAKLSDLCRLDTSARVFGNS